MKLCDTVRDLVRVATGFYIGWICALKGGRLGGGATRDIVQTAIGSWSPLKLTVTCQPFGIYGASFLKSPLEVVTLYLPWSPSEVCAG